MKTKNNTTNLARLAMMLVLAVMTSTAAWAEDVTLSGSNSYTVNDGDVLTGSTDGTVTIAAGAKITLSNVTIGRVICNGDAEITLVGTNSVSGAYQKAGIQVGATGTTLTIKGDGSLTAQGGEGAAGIGMSSAMQADATGGDVVIEGGNITATAGDYAAGIGTGVVYKATVSFGSITIKGGSVTARSGRYYGDGIGQGYAYGGGSIQIGIVTICDGIDLVDATSITDFGNVAYLHVDGETVTNVTDSKTDYFNITEDGNRKIIVPKDDTNYTITIVSGIEHGTVTGAATAKAGQSVTLTVTPDDEYRLQMLTVKNSQNYNVPLNGTTFTMPRSNVTVTALFVKETAVLQDGVLTLKGNVDANQVRSYRGNSSVTSVVCASGTVLPADCSNLFQEFLHVTTIDLSNADISGVRNMDNMFRGCISLTTIYVSNSWTMEGVLSSDYMFYLSTILVGGNGTSWDAMKNSIGIVTCSTGTYAVIDGKDGQTGYFTCPKVSFASGGASGTMDDVYVTKDTEYELPACSFFVSPYITFNNWSVVIGYAAAVTKYPGETITVTANGTATPQWRLSSSVFLTNDNWTYPLTSDVEATQATYVKTLGSERVGKHQAWLVPFDYTITSDDLEKFTFYKINMIANAPNPDTETTDEMWVFLKKLNAGDVLHANMPYVYKPKQAVTDYEFTNLNTTLKAKNTDILLDTRTTEDIYSFYATYENITATAQDPFYYVNINGDICLGNDGTVTVGPYRWIIRKTSKFGNETSYARAMHFFDGEETTSINEELRIKNEESSMVNGQWFSLDGRKLNSKPTTKGVYINGGKKVVVK